MTATSQLPSATGRHSKRPRRHSERPPRHSELDSESIYRNKLAHNVADRYLLSSIAGAVDDDIEGVIWKFEGKNKRVTGGLYGELLELHTRFST